MTKERFNQILNSATVRLSYAHGVECLFIQGVAQVEMAQLITLAGERLGAWDDGRRVNPEYLAMGPEANWHLMFHPEALKNHGETPPK